MEMASGGELLKVINSCVAYNGRQGLSEVACALNLAKFYTAELVLALEYMHNLNIVHLDLKPESKL